MFLWLVMLSLFGVAVLFRKRGKDDHFFPLEIFVFILGVVVIFLEATGHGVNLISFFSGVR